MENPLRTHV